MGIVDRKRVKSTHTRQGKQTEINEKATYNYKQFYCILSLGDEHDNIEYRDTFVIRLHY